MWWIVRKDLQLLLADRRAFVVLIALPIVFMAVIGLSTSEILVGDSNDRAIAVALVDRDGSELSGRIADVLARRDDLDLTPTDDLVEADELLVTSRVDAIVVIGDAFSARVEELGPGDVLDTTSGPLAAGLVALDVDVRARPSLRNTGTIVEGLVFGDVIRICASHVARGNRLTAWFLRDRSDETESQIEPNAASETTDATTGPAVPGLYQQIVPSYTVLFAFFLVTLMARSFLAERELRTLDRLRLAPLSWSAILAGKTLPFLMLSILQCGLLLAIGGALFGMGFGAAPWWLPAIVVATSCAATGLGLLVASLVRTDSQVSAYVMFVILVMGGVSGCMVPREFLPRAMQEWSLVTPHAWALEGFREILVESDPRRPVVLRCTAALLGFAATFTLLGLATLRTGRVHSPGAPQST